MSDIIQGILIVVFSSGTWYWSRQLPQSRTSVPGPGFFPELVSILGFVLGLYILLRAIRLRAVQAEGAAEEADDWGAYVRIGIPVVLLSILFVIAFKPLGFLVSSFVFIAAVLLLLGERRPLLILLMSAGLSGGVFYLFNNLLRLGLPGGILFR